MSETSRLINSLGTRGSWYRNAGRTTRYHKASLDWVRSGKAICGADISHPGFVARDCPAIKRALQEPCKRCLAKEAQMRVGL